MRAEVVRSVKNLHIHCFHLQWPSCEVLIEGFHYAFSIIRLVVVCAAITGVNCFACLFQRVFVCEIFESIYAIAILHKKIIKLTKHHLFRGKRDGRKAT
jgi:hypothetical protein